MSTWRVLGTGGHFERPQKTRDQDLQLLDILLLSLDHSENQAVEKKNIINHEKGKKREQVKRRCRSEIEVQGWAAKSAQSAISSACSTQVIKSNRSYTS